MELKDKKMIVTGGAGGIGSAVVKMLLSKGAVVGVVDKDIDSLNKLKESLSAEHLERFYIYPIDVGVFNLVKDAVDNFFNLHGTIDGLINNAAVLQDGFLVSLSGGKIKKYSLEDWQKTMSSNLDSYFYFAREVVEKMVLKRTKGVLVNVSSISSAGNIGQTSYAASKAAIDALTVTWSNELAMYGIRVCGLSPGMTDTPMPKEAMGEILLNEWIKRTPLKRMATVEEIAQGLIFVLENDFFCGRTLQLDGGLRM